MEEYPIFDEFYTLIKKNETNYWLAGVIYPICLFHLLIVLLFPSLIETHNTMTSAIVGFNNYDRITMSHRILL